MKHISVIGAGTMGNGIAHVFAQAGFQVNLIDLNEENLRKGLEIIQHNLSRLVAKGVIDENLKAQTLSRISSHTRLDEGVKKADLVIEAATENFDIKAKIFKELDKATPPEALLATNTSSISITRIAAETQRPDKVIGMHFMNPVPIMKLVEIINGYNTSEATKQRIVELTQKLNKIPVEANDYPGFVSNRILMPMINEAIETLYNGVAGVQQIDAVMKLGMAHPMGPLQLADFIGLDVCLFILNVLYDGFKNPKYAPCPLLQNMVAAGKLGVKSGEGFYDYTQTKKAEIVAARFA